ncbi:hypothetical protein QBC37DRAFT_388016 [Rhypophila decipiens]|uniref:Uncharacterized protein n=1 Tax=Rhypophila decipiens TaxID=261697 RepID=A0AAN7B5C6_9PEZI|nr:hypothetical protein QBC37DRAFT_388016 [Rhypophila decipiens]
MDRETRFQSFRSSTSRIAEAPTPEQDTGEQNAQNAGPASMRRFFTSSDMLRCLGERIISKSTLSALCQTSRQFDVEFSYFLYREVEIVGNWLSVNNRDSNSGWSAKRSSKLHHVRKAIVRMVWPGNPAVFNLHLCDILQRMPELRILQWDSSSMDSQTLDVIKVHCPKLKGLSVSFPGNAYGELLGGETPGMGGQWDAERAAFDPLLTEQMCLAMTRALEWRLRDLITQGLPFVQNLRYFSYYEIYGDLIIQRGALVDVLRHCLQLEHLGLSLEPYPTDGSLFFEKLCDEYGAMGGSRLRLKSLHCGRDIYPPEESSLQKLTDVSYLESLTILNDTTGHDTDPLSNAVGAFDPEKCPRLRYLWFAMHSPSMIELFSKFAAPYSDGRPPSRLLDCFTMYPYAHFADTVGQLAKAQDGSSIEPADISLPFRMLNITLAVEDTADVADPSTSDPSSPEDDKYPYCWQVKEAIESLEFLVNTTRLTLEGLAMDIPTRRTWRRGGMEVQPDIERAIHVQLPRLTKLKVLAIRVFAHEDDEAWETPEKMQLEDLARYYAQLLPGLRFIAVTDYFWRIDRNRYGVLVLEEMFDKEVGCVELFYRSWPAPLIFHWTQARDPNAILDPHPFPYMRDESHLR